MRSHLQQEHKCRWISADSGCKPLQPPTKTPLFAPYCRSGFTGGQHTLCRLPPWDLYLKCINNLREARCDTPDSPSRRNTTAHFFFCCWWINSSSLNLQSLIDQKGKPVGEMWEWEFFFGKVGGGANSKCLLQRENIYCEDTKTHRKILNEKHSFSHFNWDLRCSNVCFWTVGGNRKAMQGQIDPIKSREHTEPYLKLC